MTMREKEKIRGWKRREKRNEKDAKDGDRQEHKGWERETRENTSQKLSLFFWDKTSRLSSASLRDVMNLNEGTQKNYAQYLLRVLTHTHFPPIAQSHVSISCILSCYELGSPSISMTSTTHTLPLTLKASFHFAQQLQTASLLVCAHAAPCLFNENTKAKE